MRSNTTSSDPTRVLVVDDSEPMLARAADVLARAGCAVVGTARSGPAAIEAAAIVHPDVVVLDISMPGMSGLEVAARLRAAGSPPAVVFLTIHDEREVILAARAAGAIGYVVKPRLIVDLERAVRDAHAGRPFISPLSDTQRRAG